MLTVEVEEGIATRIESNYELSGIHPGDGRVCVKAYGLIQKTYNPNRIRQPMKRTNPRKGRDEDPGFEPISWDQAFDIIGEKLRSIRARGVLDETGVPRLAASFGGGGTPIRYMGTLPALLAAWGAVDLGFGSGQGVKCFHSEHLYGELWHRAFIVSPDTPYVRYIVNCGNNVEAAGGVAGVRRQADARARGQKRVQVEPHLSVTGAVSAEWVPSKPISDAAFLFALIHRILHQRKWSEVCDVPFLKEMSNAPYLIGPNGYYLRDPASEKPLIVDRNDGQAKPYDSENMDPALTGSHQVTGIELGPDNQRWDHAAIAAPTSFQVLLDHMAPYTPEWAALECEVPAETIRRIADEYLDHACVGETIEIEGETMPFRPVAVMLGKTVNNGWGGYHACWARTMLAVLVGALETPGGIIGCRVQLVRPADSRTGSALPGPDGFMRYKFNDTSANGWARTPEIRNAFSTLVPLVSDSPWSPALGPAHLPWLFQKETPENWPRQSLPEMWICYRTNPAISSWKSSEVAERIYGVVLSGEDGVPEADVAASEAARSDIRARRLAEGRSVGEASAGGASSSEIADERPIEIGSAVKIVSRDGGDRFECARCDHPLGAAAGDPKLGALARELPIDRISDWNRYGLVDEIVVREFCCPSCAHLIGVEVRHRDDPVLLDTFLAEPGIRETGE